MSVELKMAWRNLWRNPRRTLLTIAAIAFACLLLVFMLSWQFGSYETMINSSVKIHTGHLHVQAKGYQDKKSIRQVVTHPKEVGSLVGRAQGVEAYTYRSNAFSLVSSKQRTYGILVIGIDPAREAKVSTLVKIVRKGAYLKDDDYEGALVGDLLARNLQVGIGGELTLLGQGRDGSVAATVVKVRGIYKSGVADFDRNSIHINLKNFDDTYTMMGAVNEVVAVCTSLEAVKPSVAAIQAGLKNIKGGGKLAVLDWQELMPGLLQGIKMDLFSGLIMYFLLVIVVAFSILNTFLMSIFERMHEFGVLMAIGATPARLTRLVMAESAALTLVGIISGVILGALVTLYLEGVGIDVGASEMLAQYGISGRMYPKLSLLSASIGPGAVLVITLITALYPASKVRKFKPVEAINYL